MANNSGQLGMVEVETLINASNPSTLKIVQDPNLNTPNYYGDGGPNKGTADQSVNTHARPYGPVY